MVEEVEEVVEEALGIVEEVVEKTAEEVMGFWDNLWAYLNKMT